jgi:hypothetical protein
VDDRDVRQLRKMLAQVALYESEQIALKALIDDLEFLLSNVDRVTQSWRQEMLSKLGVLEDTYAVALDKTMGAFSSADNTRVAATIRSIVELIGSQLKHSEE